MIRIWPTLYIIVVISEGSDSTHTIIVNIIIIHHSFIHHHTLYYLLLIYSNTSHVIYLCKISRGFYPRLDTSQKLNKFFDLWLVFTHVTRRPYLCTKHYKMFVYNLHKIEISSQQRENILFLYTNMAVKTSHENDLLIELLFEVYIKVLLYHRVLAVSD